MNNKFRAWIYAFRLRTLPLALSSIITGSSIAFVDNRTDFNWIVLVLLIVTTLLLQILSNLANDYGDSEKGADNHERIGPKRAVQAGLLSTSEIKIGIVICVLLCLVSGIALIVEATKGLYPGYGIFFFALGLAAIVAAIKYTVGKNAYGYRGLGDIFVFLFFGLAGVCGSYYLLAHQLHYSVLLPACTIGLFATGVLNLNNMRDCESDAKAGKITMVVKMGLQNAKKYHAALIIIGFSASLAFMVMSLVTHPVRAQFLFIITLILFRKHLAAIRKIQNPAEFDPHLKELALSTFIFSILFGIGMIVGSTG